MDSVVRTCAIDIWFFVSDEESSFPTFPKEKFEIFDPQSFLRRLVGDAQDQEGQDKEKLEKQVTACRATRALQRVGKASYRACSFRKS